MDKSFEERLRDENFRNWLLNILHELKGEIVDEVKHVVRENRKPDLTKWVKSARVKALLGVSHGKLQSMRDTGIISYTKIGGTLYYNMDDINDMMRKNQQWAESRKKD